MSGPTRLLPHAGVEMTVDPVFAGRIRRLAVVSSVALGVVFLLALDSGVSLVSALLLVAGWATMPTVLAISLRRAETRIFLAVPSTLIVLGVAAAALSHGGGLVTGAGWWLLAAGVGFGGTLGLWFWFRWMPVPAVLDDPFSPARWSLIAAHVFLVVLGAALVAAGSVL